MAANQQGTRADVTRLRHPGAGRKRARSTPKGRQLDPVALETVQALLGDRPRRRDLLIEYLHLIQDAYNGISSASRRSSTHSLQPSSEFVSVQFERLLHVNTF